MLLLLLLLSMPRPETQQELESGLPTLNSRGPCVYVQKREGGVALAKPAHRGAVLKQKGAAPNNSGSESGIVTPSRIVYSHLIHELSSGELVSVC